MNRIRITETPYTLGFGYELRIINQEELSYVSSLNCEHAMANMNVQVPSLLNFEKNDLIKLMDQLWSLGIRPSNGTGDTNAFEAVKYHLEDMRMIVKASGIFDKYDGPVEEAK